LKFDFFFATISGGYNILLNMRRNLGPGRSEDRPAGWELYSLERLPGDLNEGHEGAMNKAVFSGDDATVRFHIPPLSQPQYGRALREMIGVPTNHDILLPSSRGPSEPPAPAG
jgi:hypothetical protein